MSYPLEHLVNSSRSDRSNNRNDRNRNQNNRDRYRNNNNNNNNNNNSNNSNRSQNNRGPVNQGPGILGAKPGDRTIPDLPANPLQVQGLLWQTAFYKSQILCFVFFFYYFVFLRLLNFAFSLNAISYLSYIPFYLPTVLVQTPLHFLMFEMCYYFAHPSVFSLTF